MPTPASPPYPYADEGTSSVYSYRSCYMHRPKITTKLINLAGDLTAGPKKRHKPLTLWEALWIIGSVAFVFLSFIALALIVV